MATWVDAHGAEAAEMATAITANTNSIAAITNATTGILATANAYTDSKIAGLPAATESTLGLIKIDNDTIKMNVNNQIYIGKITTDMIEQGDQSLVLYGGSAN